MSFETHRAAVAKLDDGLRRAYHFCVKFYIVDPCGIQPSYGPSDLIFVSPLVAFIIEYFAKKLFPGEICGTLMSECNDWRLKRRILAET